MSTPLRQKLEALRSFARANGIRAVAFSMLLNTNRAMTASESVDFVQQTTKASAERLEVLRQAGMLDSATAGFVVDDNEEVEHE